MSKLDRQVARKGQTIQLRKAAAKDGSQDKGLRAFVRGYKPDELAGGVQQGDSTVIVSPTELAKSGFAGPIVRLDRVVVAGRVRSIEVANPVMLNDQVVRIELWVRG
ncbi:hypothetical protein HCU64_06535 [Methylobacterium sp. C25]|nr:hypothetical protein [Methylobacterium sp. C25]